MFVMRFDMRAPAAGAPPAELYSAALEMCAWAETRGCAGVALCEHHASDDGYLPSPLVMASAVAARTSQVTISVTATLLPFYDPVRLAEDMNVLDLISRGRVAYVLGIGYRPEEFEHFGLDMRRRGQIAEEKLQLLLKLRSGEPVVHEGRRIHVTPRPYTPGGPMIMWGGGSVAAARRAGRYGLGLIAQASRPGMSEAYEAAARAHGHEPGLVMLPERDAPSAVFVADDVDAAWDEIGPYLLHDARTYAEWNPGDETTASICHAQSVEELREARLGHRIMSPEEATGYLAEGKMLNLVPLCGGLPPEVAWRYLERAAAVVEARGAAGDGGQAGLLEDLGRRA